MRVLVRLIFLAVIAAYLCIDLYSQDTKERKLSVTVYNNDLGVVKDNRKINLKSGESEIRITDVAERIDPTSVHIKLDGNVLEQNYQYDLASLRKILNKYIDKEVTLTKKDMGLIKGTLISINENQIAVKKESGLIMVPDIKDYQIEVGSLPEGLITKPTLIWRVDSRRSGDQEVELSYQTGGMNWHAEYVAVLNQNDTKMDLNSWVSIENNSGASYENATLKLVAGEVNRVKPEIQYNMRAAQADALVAAKPQFQEKEFFEYHIYNLQRPATVANNEVKQISLFESKDVGIRKKYLYRSGFFYYYNYNQQNPKVEVAIEFDNSEKENMGMPLPAGKVRLYKSDGETIEFIGEDMLDHTPRNEKVKLKVGDAFDIVAEDTKEDTKRISDKVSEETDLIKLRNRKKEDVEVEVERYLGSNWEVFNSSIPFTKKNANTIIFKVPVKKDSETELEFRVRYSY